MHSKPSLSPGNISHTVLYDEVLLPHGTACADWLCGRSLRGLIVRTKPARCIGKTLSFSQVPETTLMRTREHPADIDWQTTPPWNKKRSSLVRGSDLPKCHSAQSVICGVGLAARTGRGEISQAGKHTSSKRHYEYTTRKEMEKMLYFVEMTHEVAETVIYSDNM